MVEPYSDAELQEMRDHPGYWWQASRFLATLDRERAARQEILKLLSIAQSKLLRIQAALGKERV